MDGTNGEDLAVGCFLSLRTTLGDEVEGQIITFDRLSNILGASNAGSRRSVRLIKANYIRDFTVLGRGDDPLDPKKCFVDLGGIQAREAAALRQAEIDAERIGVGVTAEAQSIFDALSKTLPVKWDKTDIVVMNTVRVCSPYLPENVSGGAPAASDRVRKVLDFERKRLQARAPGHI
uniref:AD domain-containing protein n=1 Tax=Ananas comosus var. bracteatus TaxID=296719 RepID=A0A6V7P7K4_ANACO|nr:unnamed protein product [Ananas comosus var. bracteatus]